jgi:hypothetical protein
MFDRLPLELMEAQADIRRGLERLAFLHHDRRLGALVVTHFSIRMLSTGGMSAAREGLGVWDINHAQVGGAHANLTNPSENSQFAPLIVGSQRSHEDGYDVLCGASLLNTIGGLLVAHPAAPARFLAYVDMGDGGCRVFFSSSVTVPPAKVPPFPKDLPPDAIPGPGGDGAAWVTVATPDFVPYGIGGYGTPYNDFIAQVLNSDGRISAFLLVFLSGFAEVIYPYFEPRSIVTGIQPAMDLLPIMSQMTLGTGQSATVTLTQADAVALQAPLLDFVDESRPFASQVDQPFVSEFVYAPGFLFTDVEYTFKGRTRNAPAGDIALLWTFADHSGDPNDAATTQTTTVEGATVLHTFAAGVLTSDITLVATHANGTTSRVTRRLAIAESFWGTLWELHQAVNDSERVRLGSLTIDFAKYVVDYLVAPDGTRESMAITYRNNVDGQFRCFGPAEPGQGELELQMPLRIRTRSISLIGDLATLGSVVRVNSADVTLVASKRFTPCVLTSDRRSLDPLRRATYADLAREPAEAADIETVKVQAAFGDETGSAMAPAALAAKPLGGTTVRVDSVSASAVLTEAGKSLSYLVSVMIGLGLAGVAAVMIAAVLVALQVTVIGIVMVVTFTLLVALLVYLGLAAVLIDWIAPFLLTRQAESAIRADLNARSGALARRMEARGMMRYSGEGLAEALTLMVIKRAIGDGHPVPEFDPAKEAGRARFRPQMFDTIFVSEGECKVRIRF